MNIAIVAGNHQKSKDPWSITLAANALTLFHHNVTLITADSLCAGNEQTATNHQLLNILEQKKVEHIYLTGDGVLTRRAKAWAHKKNIRLSYLNHTHQTPHKASLSNLLAFLDISKRILANCLLRKLPTTTPLSHKTLKLWVYTDGKPGHKSQLNGLIQSLKSRTALEVKWINTHQEKQQGLSKRIERLKQNKNNVDFVLGAGHATHIHMLLANLFTGAKSIVLMKPSLPISWFDLAIIPKHDGVTNKKNVITTKGVLNTVQHSTIKDPTKGLILIGGASKHFSWNSKKIAQQVNAIISRTPHINWQLTTSRRTPDDTLNHLDLLQENLQVIPYEDTDSQWVNTQLEQASQTWVSVDSSSMIFEALTSGTNVGIFDLPANKNSRLQRCVNQLINDHLVMPFNTWEKSKQLYPNMAQLHESSRCANLIMDNTIENSQSAEHYPSPA